jgi:hypothetical protein
VIGDFALRSVGNQRADRSTWPHLLLVEVRSAPFTMDSAPQLLLIGGSVHPQRNAIGGIHGICESERR